MGLCLGKLSAELVSKQPDCSFVNFRPQSDATFLWCFGFSFRDIVSSNFCRFLIFGAPRQRARFYLYWLSWNRITSASGNSFRATRSIDPEFAGNGLFPVRGAFPARGRLCTRKGSPKERAIREECESLHPPLCLEIGEDGSRCVIKAPCKCNFDAENRTRIKWMWNQRMLSCFLFRNLPAQYCLVIRFSLICVRKWHESVTIFEKTCRWKQFIASLIGVQRTSISVEVRSSRSFHDYVHQIVWNRMKPRGLLTVHFGGSFSRNRCANTSICWHAPLEKFPL